MRTTLIVAGILVLSGVAGAQTVTKNDYSKGAAWLCRPGGQDACAVDLRTTVITEDGRLTLEKFTAHPNPAIDCFYVYPTVSLDAGGNSDMSPGPEERNVVRAQFARFTSQCRPFAPLYRQMTLAALRAAAAGKPVSADRTLAYNDVVDAWHHYLEKDNQNRGVVLIGHSQGAGVLQQLIRNEIDGRPVQSRIVSALLLGTNVAVPAGQDVGGAFRHMPLCRSAEQTGCVISYVSFRSTIPPPPASRFGRVADKGMQAACTNPAALGGGKGHLHAYLTTAQHQWVTPPEAIETPFVSVPRLLSAQCVSDDNGSYLEITVNEDSHDPRADEIPGDVLTDGKPNATWGLHLIDVHAALGNLIEIVSKQSNAYAAKAGVLPPFVGNWQLVKFVNFDENGAERDAGYESGRIMYDLRGHMAAQLLRKSRDNYIAYFGRVTVDVVTSTVTHHVEGASIAAWIGTDLVRYYEFSPDQSELKLSLRNAQGRVTGTLTWRRL
jgi:hypothetical protein